MNNDVEVSRDDQRKINEFGRLNRRKQEVREELSEAKRRVDLLADAEESVLLADETVPGAIKLMVGESFVDVDGMTANDFVTAERAKEEGTISKLEAELSSIEVRQGELKTALYSKLGRDNINLEDS